MPSVHEIITEKILALLDKGTVPWRKPWATGGFGLPMNYVSRKEYRGINVLMLSMQGYASRYWLTFKQAQTAGGTVKKGEKGSMCIFWKMLEGKEKGENGKGKQIPLMRYYTVFNLSQCEGIADPDAATAEPVKTFQPIDAAKAIVDGMPNRPPITHNEPKAYYSPSEDRVNMPKPESFGQPEEYYSTVYRELVHSTLHKSRLDRTDKQDGHDYAREELVGEMGAAMLCGEAGIDGKTLENSAAYIQTWRKRISDDPKLVIVAAQQGQKAADYITGRLQPKAEEADEE